MAEGAAANSGDDSGTLLRDCDVCSDSDTSDSDGGEGEAGDMELD